MRESGGRTHRQRIGDAAESRAAEFLSARGLTLIARNVRYRGGEIDLIALDGDELVFVEVRHRATTAFGGAAASVGAGKRRRLQLAASLFLMQRFGDRPWPACRFDVIAFEATGASWVRAAF